MKHIRSLFIAVVLSGVVAFMSLSRPLMGTLNWDVAGYYFYLPALFIYDDIELRDRTWFEDLRVKYDLSATLYQVHEVEGRDTRVDQYSCGMAIAYSPAFFVAHAIAPLNGDPRDGFSRTYQYAIGIWSVLIAIAGIFVFRALLLQFFEDGLSAILLALIIAGTNYLIQIPLGLATPHNYLFLLFALFLLAVLRWDSTRSWKDLLIMSGILGFACLIRPTELLAAVIPVCWGCRTRGEVWAKVRDLWRQRKTTVYPVAIVLFLFALPQMVYWQLTTGKPLYMSYSNPGEGMDFLTPHTWSFLFSFRKGWFIYTPLMAVALIGFMEIYRNKREWFIAMLLFFILNLYLVSSWSTWWYAQCFSQRAMIQSLPLMAILLGFSIIWMGKRRSRRWAGYSAVAILFGLTVFYQWQYKNRILHADRMTPEYFFAVFGKTEVSDEDRRLLLVERSFDGSMEFSHRERYREKGVYLFSEMQGRELTATLPGDSSGGLFFGLNSEKLYTPAMRFRYRDLTERDHAWLIADAEVWLPNDAASDDCLLVITADHKGGIYGYHTKAISPDQFVPGSWNTIHTEYLTPEVRNKRDGISAYLWYRGNDSVYAKEITLKVFERID